MSNPNSMQVQMRAELRDLTHGQYHHRPHSIIERVTDQGDGRVTALLTFYRYTETLREVRFTGRYQRMIEWTFDDNGNLLKRDWFDVEDAQFQPFIEARYGRGETPKEYQARRDWEAMQYRVGTAKTPMDSAGRAVDSSPMSDYWIKKG